MNKVEEALKQAKECKGCGGLLEPKFGDYHPICNPKNKGGLNSSQP